LQTLSEIKKNQDVLENNLDKKIESMIKKEQNKEVENDNDDNEKDIEIDEKLKKLEQKMEKRFEKMEKKHKKSMNEIYDKFEIKLDETLDHQKQLLEDSNKILLSQIGLAIGEKIKEHLSTLAIQKVTTPTPKVSQIGCGETPR